MAEDKKIDGIKKIDKAELDMSRRLVLDTIGEQNKESSPAKNTVSKKIDGVIKVAANIAPDIKPGPDVKERIKAGAKELTDLIAPKNETEKKSPEPAKASAKAIFSIKIPSTDIKIKTDDEKKRQAELAAKEKAAAREKYTQIKKAEAQAELKRQRELEEAKAIELKKKNEAEEKIKAQQRAVEQKKKTKEEKGRLALEEKKQKEMEREQRHRNRLEYRRLRAAKLHFRLKRLGLGIIEFLRRDLPVHLVNIARLCIFIIIFSSLLGLFIYSVSAVLIIKFKIDNQISRRISFYLPVPALISKAGIVEYYNYQDIKQSLKDCCQSDTERESRAKLQIAQDIIINQLAQKYGVSSFNYFDRNSLKKLLANRIVFDNEINLSALSRIIDIKKKVEATQEFPNIATRYGDKQGTFTLNEETEKYFNFTDELKSLNLNETSPVIYASDGYYIFWCQEKNDNSSSFNYVFIKAKTLDEYLNETIGNYKFLSLVR